MILDAENLMSNDQAITATAVSTNVIDLAGVAADMGPGEPLELLIQVTAAFDSADDDGTLTVALQTDTVAAFSSATTLADTAAIAEATMVAGYKFKLAIPREGLERYLRLNYTVAGTGDFTAGNIMAGIVDTLQQGFVQ